MIGVFNRLDLRGIGAFAVDRTKDKIAEANRAQMMAGKGSVRPIGRYRNAVYARYKNAANPQPGLGNVDLRLTGAFHKAIFVAVGGDSYEIDSSDGKTDDLVNRYGAQIFGLAPGPKTEYVEEHLTPAFQQVIERETGLKFG